LDHTFSFLYNLGAYSFMVPTTYPLVIELKNVLRSGINDLIDDTKGFCVLVNGLQDEEAELTPSERHFLEYLVPFRDKLVKDAPVIASVLSGVCNTL
jgi:hypothetical protein